MEIRIRSTGAVMYEGEFRAYQKANGGPTWDLTTPVILESLGADVVLEGPQPVPTRYQYSARDGVQQINGAWYTKYKVVDMDADARAATDEQQAKVIRDERTKRLLECDWTQLADSPVDKTAWAAYRQALRDISKQVSFPWDINWPVAP